MRHDMCSVVYWSRLVLFAVMVMEIFSDSVFCYMVYVNVHISLLLFWYTCVMGVTQLVLPYILKDDAGIFLLNFLLIRVILVERKDCLSQGFACNLVSYIGTHILPWLYLVCLMNILYRLETI